MKYNENFVNISKNLQKNRNQNFPVVHYFTLKLKFVSNILSMIAVKLLRGREEVSALPFANIKTLNI